MSPTHVKLDRRERFREIDENGHLFGEYRDVPAGTVCEVVRWDGGMALLRHPTEPRFHGRQWASFLTAVDPKA